MVKLSSSSENEPCCSKSYKKNTNSLNSKITELTNKLGDRENMLFHYKEGLAQVEARLAEHRNRELKYCEKIRVLEFKVESGSDFIESLTKELELIKKEKKDTVLFPPPAQVYSTPKKDMSWTGLPEFADDTITDYSRPSLAIESTSDDLQNKITFVTKTEASDSSISSKPFIKFVKAAIRPTKNKTDKGETVKKPAVKYAELYRKPSKGSKGISRIKLEDSMRTKRSRGSKSTKVVDYILQVKKNLLTKKLEDSEAELQV
nr:hypothetical protein [Tanacetum cinerariifolium]